jgi:hypothetical protein
VRTFPNLLSAAAMMLLAPSAALLSAQTTNMSATATVVTPLTVTKVTDLAYGTVYPGLDKIISLATNPTLMGKFTITGFSGATAYVSFALPTTLGGPGSLAIDTWTGYQGVGAATAGGGTGGVAFTPSASNSSVLLGGSATNVFIGASVHPTYGQAAGAYTGTIVMTTVYSGS